MKAEEFSVEINRGNDPQRDAFIKQVHVEASLRIGMVTGSYGAAQMALAQHCIGSMFALDKAAARLLLKAWRNELNGAPKDLVAENEAIRRLVAAEEIMRAGRAS